MHSNTCHCRYCLIERHPKLADKIKKRIVEIEKSPYIDIQVMAPQYRRGKLVVSKGCKDCHSTKEVSKIIFKGDMDASYVPILPAKMDRMPQEIYNEKCNIARMKWLELIVVTDNDLDRIKKHFTIFLREVGLVP